jgi:phytoene synthase
VTASEPISAGTLAEAFKHCAALARKNARDQWLGALYAPAGSRDALFALACFDHEIRLARLRARDPNLAALRLAWWREAALGAGDPGAGGSPAALALRAAIAAFALPGEAIEAMLDARLTEIAPPVDFTLAAFAIYAAESEGARLRLASRIAAGARDLDDAEASAPAGLALGLARMLAGLSSGATLFPADVAKRHGATRADFDAMRASAGVVAASAELRGLARERLAEAERRLKASPPQILPAFVPLATLRLDLDRLERNAQRPFDPPAEVSALRRQWAIWRWARKF